jgi:type IV pilus assembly protein PilV
MRGRRLRIGRDGSAGFSMVEVLVAVFVLSLGLLGYAATLAATVRASHTAHQRTQATALAYEAFDMIRANRFNYRQYITDFTQTTPTASTTLGSQDLAAWKQRLAAALPNGQARIQVDVTGAGATQQMLVRIFIRWDESRGEADADDLSTRLEMQAEI